MRRVSHLMWCKDCAYSESACDQHGTQVTLVSATGLRKLGAEPSSRVRLRILNTNPKVRL